MFSEFYFFSYNQIWNEFFLFSTFTSTKSYNFFNQKFKIMATKKATKKAAPKKAAAKKPAAKKAVKKGKKQY